MVLPSSNVPETARITRIVHTPLQDGEVPQLTYTTSDGEVRRIAGEYGIRERSHLYLVPLGILPLEDRW